MLDDSNPAVPRIVRRAFADFDDAAASFKCAEILRRTRGPYQAALISAELGPIALVWSSHTPPIIAHATVGSSHRMFLMRPDSDGAVLVNGHALDEQRLVDHRPGTEMHMTTSPGRGSLRLVEILARPEELDRVSVALTGGPFSSGPSLCTLLEPDTRALASLRSLCATMHAAIEDPDALASADSLAALAKAMLGAVVAAVSSDRRRKYGRELTRDFQARIVRRADAFLRAHIAERISLSDICAAVGTTERQLQRAFHAVYGIGPKRYLQIRRLHLARSALRNHTTGETTVARIAMRFGFSDLGRFATAYQALFGEAPSATLRRERNPRLRLLDLSRSTYPLLGETLITHPEVGSRLGESTDESATPRSAVQLPGAAN